MEKFTSLSKEATALYLQESPIIILAQALLKDNSNGNVFAQIKFRNLSDKPICALKVRVTALDVTGKSMPSIEEFQYLDLSVKPGDDFGSKTLIPLPDKSSRGFKVTVLEAVFADKAVWTSTADAVWEALPEKERLVDRLKSAELVEEYALATCAQAQFVPTQYGDIWLCTCGNVNKTQNENCGTCGQKYDDLICALDVEALEASYKERKKRESELAEKEQTEAAAKRNRRKKYICITLAVAVLCTAAALVTAKIVMPIMEYNSAVKPNNEGEYANSVLDIFNNCSKAIKTENKYNEAISAMEGERYSDAQITFEDLNGYKDSLLKAEECKEKILEEKYSEAIGDMRARKYTEAAALLTEILKEAENYNDAAQMLYKAELNMCEVGDSFYFGEYEQEKNGLTKSPIEWTILKKENGRVLMISKYGLDMKPYEATAKKATWANCSLRKWLNETFLESAFSQDEQDLIKLTSIDSSKDKVFLLSRTEVQSYFKSDESRKVKGTEFAKKGTKNIYWCWWLRSQSDYRGETSADAVDESGSVDRQLLRQTEIFNFVVYSELLVRPAIWVDIG